MFKKNVFLKFSNIFVVGALKKNIFHTRKMENGFFVQWKVKLSSSTLSVLPRCMFVYNMGIFNKLCHVCGHNTCHLDRKSRIFVEDSSFLWTPFEYNCRIPSLLFLVASRTYIMTPHECLTSFWFFFSKKSWANYKAPVVQIWPVPTESA